MKAAIAEGRHEQRKHEHLPFTVYSLHFTKAYKWIMYQLAQMGRGSINPTEVSRQRLCVHVTISVTAHDLASSRR